MKASTRNNGIRLAKIFAIFILTFIVIYGLVYFTISVAACTTSVCDWSEDLKGAYGFGTVISFIAAGIVAGVMAGASDWD